MKFYFLIFITVFLFKPIPASAGGDSLMSFPEFFDNAPLFEDKTIEKPLSSPIIRGIFSLLDVTDKGSLPARDRVDLFDALNDVSSYIDECSKIKPVNYSLHCASICIDYVSRHAGERLKNLKIFLKFVAVKFQDVVVRYSSNVTSLRQKEYFICNKKSADFLKAYKKSSQRQVIVFFEEILSSIEKKLKEIFQSNIGEGSKYSDVNSFIESLKKLNLAMKHESVH